jgi:hypothetical protein
MPVTTAPALTAAIVEDLREVDIVEEKFKEEKKMKKQKEGVSLARNRRVADGGG